eukprot:TRINITY_DN19948_c0_g1_i1.p1 TRINITY_DN19948_c0_g1~~TRINITY_DN19948_c0_g1_i1.p1  ORF type:complete len:180 (+),score=26.61 TRINITY_DN19948_c0_g1_i1:57-542(+)
MAVSGNSAYIASIAMLRSSFSKLTAMRKSSIWKSRFSQVGKADADDKEDTSELEQARQLDDYKVADDNDSTSAKSNPSDLSISDRMIDVQGSWNSFDTDSTTDTLADSSSESSEVGGLGFNRLVFLQSDCGEDTACPSQSVAWMSSVPLPATRTTSSKISL